MKSNERRIARELRTRGLSLRAISAEVKCSKSTVSRWIRDIALTEDQIDRLKSNQDRARAKAANHPNSPKRKWEIFRSQIIKEASREIPRGCTRETLKYIGTVLYWAEGYNASRNAFTFSNSDPAMIKIMMKFLLNVCGVPGRKLRGRVNIHPHLDIEKAKRYWSKISGIPLPQFHKPLLSVSKASKHKRDTLPLGTFNIVISDVALCSRIKGWIEGIKQWGK